MDERRMREQFGNILETAERFTGLKPSPDLAKLAEDEGYINTEPAQDETEEKE